MGSDGKELDRQPLEQPPSTAEHGPPLVHDPSRGPVVPQTATAGHEVPKSSRLSCMAFQSVRLR